MTQVSAEAAKVLSRRGCKHYCIFGSVLPLTCMSGAHQGIKISHIEPSHIIGGNFSSVVPVDKLCVQHLMVELLSNRN